MAQADVLTPAGEVRTLRGFKTTVSPGNVQLQGIDRSFETPHDADSVDGVTADSAKLPLRALEILKEQGQGDDYSADEYILAIEKAAA